jgi:NADPH:quinone reductase-like Zn-dependent oxidoreductase
VDTANIQPGQRVLVHAAAGGVGHLAAQIAKALGAHVIGTASAAKHDFVRGLGADEVIDYRTQDFTKATGDLEVVLDTIGGDYDPSPARCSGPTVSTSDSWVPGRKVSCWWSPTTRACSRWPAWWRASN